MSSAEFLPAKNYNLEKFASWNKFPKSIWNLIIKSSWQEKLDSYNDTTKLYINLPYMVNLGKQIVRNCIKKLKRNILKQVQLKFVITCNTNKLSFFYKYTRSHYKTSIFFRCISLSLPPRYHYDITAITLKKQRANFGKKLMNIAITTRTARYTTILQFEKL